LALAAADMEEDDEDDAALIVAIEAMVDSRVCICTLRNKIMMMMSTLYYYCSRNATSSNCFQMAVAVQRLLCSIHHKRVKHNKEEKWCVSAGSFKS
jgi:hypothetical protein